MLIIKKDNSINDYIYRGLIGTSYGGQFGTNNYFFNQDGIFLSKEEVFAIKNSIHELKKCLNVLDYDAVKEKLWGGEEQ